MMTLSHGAASTYRRIDLDARIEAASGADLTRICLEEAVSALGLAMRSLEQKPGIVPRHPLSRAQAIALFLARSVDPGNPLRSALTQFYGGIASTIGNNLKQPSIIDIREARRDLEDLLQAARAT